MRVDFYKDFIEFKKLEENTSSSVIEIFKEQFSRNGVPEKLETVDAPQFTSYEFHHFPFDWEFKGSLLSKRLSKTTKTRDKPRWTNQTHQ